MSKKLSVYPHAITHELAEASHFLQEDAPEKLVQWIEAFIKANP
jgi:pimeloyl-ACP methyl ester carboxylesterase